MFTGKMGDTSEATFTTCESGILLLDKFFRTPRGQVTLKLSHVIKSFI